MSTTLKLKLGRESQRRLSRRAADHGRTVEAELTAILKSEAAPPRLLSVREVVKQFRGIGFTPEEVEAIAALRQRAGVGPVALEE